MADTKISALTVTATLADADELVLASSGANKKIAAASLRAAPAVTTISNLWVPLWAYAGLSTQAFGTGLLRVGRTVLPMAVKTVQLEVTTAVAGSILRVGVFADTASGPGALLYQSADFSGASAVALTAALGPVPAGTYWIGVQNTGASGGPTLRCASGSNPFLTGNDLPGANNLPNSWSASAQGTALPNPFPLGSVSRSGLTPALWLQAA